MLLDPPPLRTWAVGVVARNSALLRLTDSRGIMEVLGTLSSVLESHEEPWGPLEGKAVGMGTGATFLWE